MDSAVLRHTDRERFVSHLEPIASDIACVAAGSFCGVETWTSLNNPDLGILGVNFWTFRHTFRT
jgi:hypothetical protein